MKIDDHISELLFDHDCVIVPSFGGFLASYEHAKIHSSLHTFSPPSKKIAFNIFLKQNDGLLANHVAGHEKLSYADALQQVEFFVNHCQKELAGGKKITFERVGVFYFDREKNLQFESFKNINYLRDAFGFSAIQYLPVQREGYQRQVEKQIKEIISPRASLKQEKMPIKLSGKSTKKLLSAVIITGTLLWFSFNLYLITPQHFNLSSFNPFSLKSKTEFKRDEVKPATQQQVKVSPAFVDSLGTANMAPLTESETRSANENLETKAVPIPAATPVITNKKFFVIGGAFQFRENADAFVKALRTEGFPDAQILDTARHLKMVCFNGFLSLSEASIELDRLKTMNKNGWIYAR